MQLSSLYFKRDVYVIYLDPPKNILQDFFKLGALTAPSLCFLALVICIRLRNYVLSKVAFWELNVGVSGEFSKFFVGLSESGQVLTLLWG